MGPRARQVVIKDVITDSMFSSCFCGRRVLGDRHDNLNGDYLSDACAAQVGVSAWRRRQYRRRGRHFRGDPRTAPKYAGQDKVNRFLI